MKDQMNERKEILIDFRELMRDFLKISKSVILCVVICVIGALVVSFCTHSTTDAKILNKLEKQYTQLVDDYNEAVDYVENATYMQLNASKVSSIVMQYIVRADDAEVTTDSSVSYYYYISQGGLLEDVKKTYEDKYVGDLIKYTWSNHELAIFSNVINIEILGVDQEACEELSDIVSDCLEKFAENVQSNVGEHSMVLVNSFYKETDQEDVLTQQKSKEEKILTLETQLLTAKDELDAAHNGISIRGIMVCVLLGVVLGVCVPAVFVFVKYIFSDVIKSKDALKDRYGLWNLGEFKTKAQDASANFNIVSKIELLLENKEDKSVVLLTELSEEKERIFKEQAKALFKENIHYEISKEISTNVKNIVFVREVDVSRYATLKEELTLCKELELNIVGYLTVE